MIQLITDLANQGAVDGYVIDIPDGEAMGDRQGGTFRWSSSDTNPGDDPGIGANIVKVTGVSTGSWIRQPNEDDQNSKDIQSIEDQIAGLNLVAQWAADDALFPYQKRLAVLASITAGATMARANVIQPLGNITTNQTLVLPPVADNVSKIIYLPVTNTGVGIWQIGGIGLRNGKTYGFMSDGTTWFDISSYNRPVAIFKPASGATVQLLNNTLNMVRTTNPCTLTMPASPKHLDICSITFPQTTGSLTYTGGTTLVPDQSSGSAKSNRDYIWDATVSQWL